MVLLRFWCMQCGAVVEGGAAAACQNILHAVKRIGVATAVDICVTDRAHDIDVNRFGYFNNVGHAAGRDSVGQERHTRARIEEMRKRALEQKRIRHLSGDRKDDPAMVGAIPAATLFSLKRQYGQDYVREVERVMRSQGLWWGR